MENSVTLPRIIMDGEVAKVAAHTDYGAPTLKKSSIDFILYIHLPSKPTEIWHSKRH